MQRLEVSGAVRPIYGSLGVKRLRTLKMFQNPHLYLGFYSSDFLANSHMALHTHIPYKLCELRSVIVMITVFKEQCTFSAVSRLPLERFS